jgi:hypothetical protein
VGTNERWIRLGAGMATGIVAAAAPMPRTLRGALLVAAGAQMLTALTRYCPVNAMLGINNCCSESRRPERRHEFRPTASPVSSGLMPDESGRVDEPLDQTP